MKLTHDGEKFIFRCSFERRDVPKFARFNWSVTEKIWHTSNIGVAAKLAEFADSAARKILDRMLIRVTPWTGEVPVPKGLKLRPYQVEAVKWALSRRPAALMALDPRLGKAVITVAIDNADPRPTLCIVPPHLARNQEAEFVKWSTRLKLDQLYRIEKGTDKIPPTARVVIAPDSLIAKTPIRDQIFEFVADSVVTEPRLNVDESHRYKDPDALRTRSLLGHKPKKKQEQDKATHALIDAFAHVLLYSGTPMPNRMKELFPMLSKLAPETIGFRDFFDYARKYCAAHETRFGWDFDGASNVTELAKKLDEKFRLRVKRKDVMPQLPEKIEQIMFIGEDLPPKLHKLERYALQSLGGRDLMKAKIGEEHVATYRKELGKLKVPIAASFVKETLKDTDEKLLVFAHHREVIEGLEAELSEFSPFVIYGGVSNSEKHRMVSVFQTCERPRVMILQIQSAGTGLTLSKASRVIFVEPSWVPGENEQAADRMFDADRGDNVFAQYLVFRNSLDRTVLEDVLKKQAVINQLDQKQEN